MFSEIIFGVVFGSLTNKLKLQSKPISFSPGLSPNNKRQQISQNSGKIFRFLKIPEIFQIVFQSTAPKYLVRKKF
jgi:hypothetical protein